MSERYFHVDAFTDEPFRGNPASVVMLQTPRDDIWLQGFAREMNAPMTAYLWRERDGFRIRWFSPKLEVDICGHATLASAHALWTEGFVPEMEAIRLYCERGKLVCRLRDGWIEIDLPIAHPLPCEAPPGLEVALGCGLERVYRNDRDSLIVELADERTVRTLTPDVRALAAIQGVLGVAVTAPGSAPYHCVSRYFAPACGIDEDSVCGSVHCSIGPLWSERLGVSELLAYQASARGGELRVRIEDDRVILGGRAVTTMSGCLTDSSAHKTTPASDAGAVVC